jgi:AcrR family transcriptional regulator
VSENRDILLDKALLLFAKLGYEGCSVREIVELAGVTKPTLYHYFQSKEGVLEAVLEKKLRPLIQRLKLASEYHGDLPWTIMETAKTVCGFARSNNLEYTLFLSLYFSPIDSTSWKIARVIIHEIQDVLVDLFEAAVENHGNMRGRSTQYARSFLAQMNSSIHMHFQGLLSLEEADLYRIVHQFSHGIYS